MMTTYPKITVLTDPFRRTKLSASAKQIRRNDVPFFCLSSHSVMTVKILEIRMLWWQCSKSHRHIIWRDHNYTDVYQCLVCKVCLVGWNMLSCPGNQLCCSYWWYKQWWRKEGIAPALPNVVIIISVWHIYLVLVTIRLIIIVH